MTTGVKDRDDPQAPPPTANHQGDDSREPDILGCQCLRGAHNGRCGHDGRRGYGGRCGHGGRCGRCGRGGCCGHRARYAALACPAQEMQAECQHQLVNIEVDAHSSHAARVRYAAASSRSPDHSGSRICAGMRPDDGLRTHRFPATTDGQGWTADTHPYLCGGRLRHPASSTNRMVGRRSGSSE